jgi:hypothetical protein
MTECGNQLSSLTKCTPRPSSRKLPEEERKQRRKDAQQRYRDKNRKSIREKVNANTADGYQKAYYAKNSSKIRARATARYAENPETFLDAKLRRQYGISLEERDALLLGQGGVCAICLRGTPTSIGWVVDHCHKAGNVRGILCANCNTALGMVKDNPATLAAAITYLGK